MARQILGKVVPTGEDTYDNNRTYDELCIVMYNGQSYISKKETRGNKPDNTEYWQQLVEKPVKGTDYFTEADKDEIVNDVTNDATNKYNQAVTTGMEKFDQNAERKTSDFNDNASEKTDTYNANADSATKTFTNNANSKTEAYNTNATEKLGTYNSNHTKKLKEYNDNATSKLSAYNANTVTKTTEYNSNHTNKINAYDTNASDKVDAYNTNADTRLEEYNTNADTKINEYDEHSKELNNKIVSTRNELERLKSNVLNTGEDTDTFIHLEDSAMAELQEIKVDGVLSQETTTGKNLFDENNVTKTLILDDGSISANSKWNMSDYINVDSNTSYTFSRNDSISSKQSFIIAEYDENKNFIKRNSQGVVSANIPYTITTTATTKYVLLNYNNTYSNSMMQFEKGSTSTSYEKYTNGQPSPSPDYPQEIKTITDGLKVTSCGKNLVERMVLGELNTKTGIFEQSSTIICNERYIPYDGLKQYYIKVDNASGTANIRWYNQKFEYIGYGTTQSSGLINEHVYTDLTLSIPSDTTPKYFKIRRADTTLLNSTWCVSTDQNYFGEYIESQIQTKLPEGEFIGKFDETHKDTLRAEYFPEEGQYHWMLDKVIGMGDTSKYFGNVKRIFTKQNNYRFTFDINIDKIPNSNTIPEVTYPLYCNKFIKGSRVSTYEEINSISYGTSVGVYSQIVLYYSEIKDFTITQFSDWLTNNPLIIYYILQKPYTLDLGVIDMPMSYKDITNIFTDSDLLPTINAKYYRVFDKTIQNAQINEKTLKQEITDLNATVSALDTRLKALETKTVEEPTESEGTV